LRAGGPRSQGGTMADQFSGWHTRGYLPHYDIREKVQAITYRLWDALPREVCAQLDEQVLGDAERRERLEARLDAGYGSRILAAHGNAEIVVDAWKHLDGERYRLHVWCVMPNHVHVLIAPVGGHRLPEIVQSQKSYTAKIILGRCPGTAGLRPAIGNDAGETPAVPGAITNHAGEMPVAGSLRNDGGGTPAVPGSIKRRSQLWYPDYYDRFIRDERHYAATVDYIHQNPVRAGLVSHPEAWPWSSAASWDRGPLARHDEQARSHPRID
jgi:REP element-mobilizing transposase RayT